MTHSGKLFAEILVIVLLHLAVLAALLRPTCPKRAAHAPARAGATAASKIGVHSGAAAREGVVRIWTAQPSAADRLAYKTRFAERVVVVNAARAARFSTSGHAGVRGRFDREVEIKTPARGFLAGDARRENF